jgi:hypothetical protein
MCSDKSSTNQRADHDVVSPRGPTIFIADPHRGDAKRFVVRADKKLTGVCGTGKSSLYSPIDRTMLTTIAATDSVSLCEQMKS